MSQSDWHAAGGAALAAPPRADAPAEARHGLRDGAVACAAGEEDFPALSPSQQLELLALAERQGLLPAGPARATNAPPPDADAARSDLAALFSSSNLPPAPLAEPIEPVDRELDRFQIDAVGRALQTPDVFLIQGSPGTGKKRVIAEVIRQAVREGRRVLLVGPGAAIDAVLDRLDGAHYVNALRCVGREERLESMPASAAARTLKRRETAIAAEIRSRAASALTAAEGRIRAIGDLQALWPDLNRLVARHAELTAQLDETRARLGRVADGVRQEAEAVPEGSPLGATVQALAKEHSARLARLEAESVEMQKRRAEAEGQRTEARTRLGTMRHLVEARQSGRWWTGSFWKARFDKGLTAKVAEQESMHDRAEAALGELNGQERTLNMERERAEGEHRERRTRILEEEATRRTADLLVEEAAGAADLAGVRHEMLPLCERVATAGIDLPAEPSPETVRAAEFRSTDALREAQRHLHFARQWAAFTESEIDSLLRRVRDSINIVAGPLSSLATDSYFSVPSIRDACYDLLIVADAHLLSEADYLPAAHRATRWLLVGEPTASPVGARPSQPPRSGRPAPTRPSRPVPDFFARLVERLHHESWSIEAGRLCCRLHPVRPEQRQHLESERVADNPDIELRILTPPSGEPVLAEILFPGSTTPVRAKEYLLRELNEIPARPRCRTAYWAEESAGVSVRFEVCEPDERLPIGDGIAEWLCGTRTVGFSFETPAWDRTRAEDWLHKQLLKHDPGRVATLATPHGTAPGLAAWFNGFLDGSYSINSPKAPEPAVFFVPVPAHPGRRELFSNPLDSSGRRGHPTRQGGAGYETDLGNPKARERLSPDLLKSLPATGFVNLPEADRVVQKLQELSTRLPGASLGVAAPYPAQAALIRRLAERSPRLAGVLFAGPDGWEHRVCDVVFLRLWRGDVSLAVTFGEAQGLY